MRPIFATCAACTPRSQAAAPEFVFHLAAQPIVRQGYANPRETFDVNVMGTVNLLEAVRVLERPCVVLVITSDKCYENREQTWGYRESMPWAATIPTVPARQRPRSWWPPTAVRSFRQGNSQATE